MVQSVHQHRQQGKLVLRHNRQQVQWLRQLQMQQINLKQQQQQLTLLLLQVMQVKQ